MRRRILLLVVGMTVLVVLAFAIPLTVLIRSNAYDSALNDLKHDTSQLGSYLRASNTVRTPTQISAELTRLDAHRAVSVQLPSGRVLGTLPPGDRDRLPGARGTGAPGGFGDGRGGAGGEGGQGGRGAGGGPIDPSPSSWQDGRLATLFVPTFGRDGVYVVRLWESDGALHSGEEVPLLALAGASIALIALGVLLGEIVTRRIVRPLVETAGTAQRLSAGDVAARAPTSGPREVGEVGAALNRLADRIDELIAEERETAADLSHRLRTPLTALRLDAEALRDPDEAARMGAHATDLERTLTAVIRAARRPQREGRMPSCDAASVARERVEFWSALAEDQARSSTITLPQHAVPVRAAAEDLAAAVDALLENVVAHTPEGTPFAVALDARPGGGARLTVSDDGPGLPPDRPERGRSDRGSSGLGLSIARRCAEASGGAMTLGAGPSGGAVVTLELGAP